MVLFFLIVLIALLISLKWPDFMFWLALTIFMDPGGYIQFYLNRSMIGGLQVWDLQFVLLMLPLVSPKIKIGNYFKYKDNRWLFNFLFFFGLFYHVFIYGYIDTGGDIKLLIDLLQYERLTIVGFVVIIPAYIFFKRSYPVLIKFAFISSVVLALFYLISISTDINLLPINSYARGLGTDALRISMVSYGYAYWFILVSVVILLFRIKLPKEKWIYFVGIVLFIAVILTLTRRSILALIFSLFIIYFLHQKFINQPVLSWKIIKVFFALGIAALALSVIAPKYLGYSFKMINNVASMVQPVEDLQQIQDNRIVFDIPQHLARFKQSPYLGYGYDALWYSNNPEESGLSANDVPLTAALGMFGVVGLLCFSFYYFKIFAILYRNYKILKVAYRKNIPDQIPLVFTINLILLASFIISYTLNFMGYFGDLISGVPRVKIMINLGFLLASRDIILTRLPNTIAPKII